jgi:hypothetical protein
VVTFTLLSSSTGWADITSVNTTPGTKNIPLGRSASVSLVWNVARLDVVQGVDAVTSTVGIFRAGNSTGPVLGAVQTVLSQTRAKKLGQTTNFAFKENVLVPSSIIFQAQQSGANQIVYQRLFNDGAAGLFGQITLPITSPSAAGFSISRVQLQFEDGAPTKLVERETPLQILAVINFNGTGLLEATWQLAGPTSTAGQPIFRNVQTVRRYLYTGTSPITLRSPPVSTADAGLYLVSLRITTPEVAFTQPVIQYFVGQAKTTARPPAPLALAAPRDFASLERWMTFSWEAIDGAHAYRLEIYPKAADLVAETLPALDGSTGATTRYRPSGPRVTGTVLPGNETETLLSPAVRRHLKSGQSYLWRVLAVDKDGNLIAASPLRVFKVP